MKHVWTVAAPSNIALIKYMGKIETEPDVRNHPTNSSLSYTLPHLQSYVQIEYDPNLQDDTWEPLTALSVEDFGQDLDPIISPLQLSEKGQSRFLAHLSVMRANFDFHGFFRVRSANGFPSDCGLASSASSFAALTRVAFQALSQLMNTTPLSQTELANWSRLGSGSSCRSFFAPWSLWTPGDVRGVPELTHFDQLIHQVVVVDEKVKLVSSSEAHRRVLTSLSFQGRPARADQRVNDFIAALETNAWRVAYEIAWAEFWDMHALFETCQKPFGYMTSGSIEVLSYVRDQIWARDQDGPIVTMDAGPNVHLLYRNDSRGQAHANEVRQHLERTYRVISSGRTFGSN